MTPITVNEWINRQLVADQSSLIWYLLDNSPTQVKRFNNFFAWNMKTDSTFESQAELNEFLFKEADEIKRREYEIQKLINSRIDEGQFIYQPAMHSPLFKLLTEVELLKKENDRKIAERINQIHLFKNHVVWQLLTHSSLAQLFIDLGLPILNVDTCFWWGYFGNYSKQELFYSRFEKRTVNPLDPCQIIVSDLRQTLMHYGDLPGPSFGGLNPNSFYKRLKNEPTSLEGDDSSYTASEVED